MVNVQGGVSEWPEAGTGGEFWGFLCGFCGYYVRVFYVFFYHLENLSEIQLDFLIVFQDSSWYNEVNKKAHDEGCGIDV